jgi:anti-anti-sigma factor
MSTTTLFEVQRLDDVLVVTPTADLGESQYQDIESASRALLELVAAPEIKGVVLDFRRTDYYGSTALGFFLRLWKRLSGRAGRLAFCNVSQHEKEILTATRLDTLWPICGSREEALRVVKG